MVIIVFLLLIALLAILGCIYGKKPTVRVILGTIAFFIIMLDCLLGATLYVIRYKINPVDISLSPDGAYELLFQQIGDPDFPFGDTHVRLVLKNSGSTVVKVPFDIADDGTNASANNWNVNWKSSSVEIFICGDEQNDVLYIINFDGTYDSKRLDTYYGRTVKELYQHESDHTVEKTTKIPEVSADPSVDADGYPLADEYQTYKKELQVVADFIGVEADHELQYYLTAKGYPYAVISDETTKDGQTIKMELILNELYQDETTHEYVLEELSFDSSGNETASPRILDFYLIDCNTMNVTDEHINTWH